LFARGKTGQVKNDAMPPKVGRVTSDGKRVFEPSHHDSPLGQIWASLGLMDHLHTSWMTPMFRADFLHGTSKSVEDSPNLPPDDKNGRRERRASNLFTTFLTSPPDLERFFQASKRQ